MRRVLGVVCFAVVWSLATLAAGQPAGLPLELTWHAPSECPSDSEVRVELSRIARPRAGRTLRPLTAKVHVHKTGNGFEAALHTELDGQGGERELRASDCATLARSVTLVLALAFGPDVEIESTSTPSPTPEPVPPQTVEAPPTAEPAAEPVAPPEPEPEPAADKEGSSSLRVGMLLSGGTELTLLPAPSALLTAGILLELSPSFMVQLRVSALPAISEPIDATSATASFDAIATTALGCGRLASLVELCGGARVALVRARASGLFRDDSALAPWYALFASAGAVWPATGALRIGLEAALAVSLYRPRFAAHGLTTVHRAPLLAPELSVQLQLWP